MNKTISIFSSVSKLSFLLIILSFTFINCGEDDNEPMDEFTGTFTATMETLSYSTSVKCIQFDEDFFTFRSDESTTEDSNGDGLLISGNQSGDVISLTIVDNGNSYSAGNITISKSGNTATGGGIMFLQGGNIPPKTMSYSVTCE